MFNPITLKELIHDAATWLSDRDTLSAPRWFWLVVVIGVAYDFSMEIF